MLAFVACHILVLYRTFVRCSVSGFVGSGCQSVVLCRASSALVVSPLFCVGLRRLWLSFRCSVSGFVGSGCLSVVLCRASSALAVIPLFCDGLRRLWLSVRCSVSGFVGSGCQSVVLCRALSALAVSPLFCCVGLHVSLCLGSIVLRNIKLTYFLCVAT